MRCFRQFLFASMLLLLTPPAFASGDITGAFTGKVTCQAGIKKAEFKDPHTLSLSYATAATIKRRIDAVTWPSSGETLSFTEREKEKTSLQHALKLLKDLSCEEGGETTGPAAPVIEPSGSASGHKGPGMGPGLNPNPD